MEKKISHRVKFLIISFTSLFLAVMFKQHEPIFWLGLFGFFSCIVISVFAGQAEVAEFRENMNKISDQIIFDNGLTATQKFLSLNRENGIAIDEHKNKIAFLYKTSEKSYQINSYDFSQVIEVEIIKDGETVTRTSKAGLLGGAAVGNLLAGGFGLIAGAMGSNKTSSEKVKQLSIRIILEDLSNPAHKIYFVNTPEAFDQSSEEVVEALQDIDRWYGILTIIMKRLNQHTKIM